MSARREGGNSPQKQPLNSVVAFPTERDTLSGMDASLLTLLASRASARLTADADAQAYLKAQGVADETVWARYRLGAGHPSVLADLSDEQKATLKTLGMMPERNLSALAMQGILIPTCDPRDFENVVGFVKINYAQSKHACIGRPAGLACTADISEQKRIILTDNPLLALRLAQHGAAGVAVAEAPEVVEPLADWLKTKEIVLAYYRRFTLEGLGKEMERLGIAFSPVRVHGDLGMSGAQALTALGIDAEALAKPELPKADATIVARVAAYARQRLLDGHGQELLRDLGADDPAFVEAFQIGYLPKDFRQALPKELRHLPNLVANAVVIPACDEAGNVADLMLYQRQGHTSRTLNVLDEPQGLIGSKVIGAFDEIVAVQSFKVAAKLFSVGVQNVVLFRDAADAARNAQRIVDAGVERVTVAHRRQSEGEKIAEALKAVGLEIEFVGLPKTLDSITAETVGMGQGEEPRIVHGETPPLYGGVVEPKVEAPGDTGETDETSVAEVQDEAPEVLEPEAAVEPAVVPQPEDVQPEAVCTADLSAQYPAPELVAHDEKMMRASFRSGDASYEIDTAFDVGSRLEVAVTREEKRFRDVFNVAKAAQRERYAKTAALNTGVPYEAVLAHLDVLLEAVRELQRAVLDPSAQQSPKARRLSDAEKTEALAVLRRPDLLEAVAADLEALGWVGEEKVKRLLFLVAISRKLQSPLHAVLRSSSGSGKSFGLETLVAATPEEETETVAALTGAALYHQRLRHKLLLLAESDVLDRAVTVQLRVLLSDGVLRKAASRVDPVSNRPVGEFQESEGPVAFVTSTTQNLDREILDRCYDLTLDESEEQTQRILEAQRRASMDAQARKERDAALARLRNLQRMVEPLAVTIPFADRVVFPSFSVRHRREHQRFLRLIEASALLHQHQRQRLDGCVLATEADFAVARDLASPQVERAADDLSVGARELLRAVVSKGLAAFTLGDVRPLLPSWSRHRFLVSLDELARLQFVTSPLGGRGKAREYRVLGTPEEAVGAEVRLMPIEQLSKLPTVVEARKQA